MYRHTQNIYQLFLNIISWVQDLTFKYHQESTKQIDQMIINVFQLKNTPWDKSPSITQRYNTIGQPIVIHSQIICHQYHILLQRLSELKNWNPNSLVAPQSNNHSRFFQAFIGSLLGIAKAQKYFLVPILFIKQLLPLSMSSIQWSDYYSQL